ncbi:phylloplanin-like [Abeliophyllum distichum]|uniref:Phylloplanin-like n=1 Tax=Abeliophyllum distichum TaxID=126358 RepID=A0ABD1VBD1_9LAMI
MDSYCTNVNLNTLSTYATVQLICLGQNVLDSTTTSSNGAFTLTMINGSPTQLATLPTCRVLVVTPLTSCNATLPGNGRLLPTGLQLAGINLAGTSINILFTVLGFILNIGIN